MFSGGKAALRPLYDKLLKLSLKTGKEAKACPCQTIVPLYRNHVFAQIKPATQTRIDMGFALGDMKPKGRLIDTGGFAKKDRITHRIPITSLADIDDEVRHWLKVVYDRDVEEYSFVLCALYFVRNRNYSHSSYSSDSEQSTKYKAQSTKAQCHPHLASNSANSEKPTPPPTWNSAAIVLSPQTSPYLSAETCAAQSSTTKLISLPTTVRHSASSKSKRGHQIGLPHRK